MRFRQVHLDFHTSEAIPGIGSAFSKEQFQNMLRKGHVDSITVFSKCHHGWAYHPSEANEMHPGLAFDLLGAMIEAAHEINVKTPVYVSAGLDEKLARIHPDWLMRDAEERMSWTPNFLKPGYHQFCLNTPYLDVLIRQIEEVVSRYDLDGLFLDIVGERECYCQHCTRTLRSEGEDPRDAEAVRALGRRTYATYTRRVREAVDAIKPGLPVFHNGGHIPQGRLDLARMNSHLEVESLPTGGWGYDHFPLSARYIQPLGIPFLGMTGKFHTWWGEFGGYKHPNALRYETSLSLAMGARCSIGDQLPPNGWMDEATYELIGAAYAEVEQKEPWCGGVEAVADIALLSAESVRGSDGGAGHGKVSVADAGAVRMLLELQLLFDVVDKDSDWSKYRVVVLPDHIELDETLLGVCKSYVNSGGKLLATGRSGLRTDGNGFAIDFGARYLGDAPYQPDYFRPGFPLASLPSAAFVMYAGGVAIEADGGTVLGEREEPYFNRDVFTFCSHQHTPNSGRSGGPGMTEGPDGIYFAWRLFTDYAENGSLFLKETFGYAINRLLDGCRTLRAALPAQGIATLQRQREHNRLIAHLLYASPVRRGKAIEVIEDIVPLSDIQVDLALPSEVSQVRRVYLAPQMSNVPYSVTAGVLSLTVPRLEGHQMIVFEY